MKVNFQIIPEDYVGYDAGIATIHIKKSELTPNVQSYLEEKLDKIDIKKIEYER